MRANFLLAGRVTQSTLSRTGGSVKFFKYWACAEADIPNQERSEKVRAYGGSHESQEEAPRRAQESAVRLATLIERGEFDGEYGYGDRPVREEILQEISGRNGLTAVITRNSYGSLILNSARVMFIDIDNVSTLSPITSIHKLWKSFFNGEKPALTSVQSPLMEHVEQVVRKCPGIGGRGYRTAWGYRLLITSDVFDPVSASAHSILSAFGSDPLYSRLCKLQECFRARLSAKYWRCGADRPPSRYPWRSPSEEQRYRRWEEAYHHLANQFATCEFVGSFGSSPMCDEVQSIMELHDKLTLLPGAQLA